MATYAQGRLDSVRRMAAKYDGQCRSCGDRIPQGSSQFYGGRGQGVRCTECGPHPEGSKPGTKRDPDWKQTANAKISKGGGGGKPSKPEGKQPAAREANPEGPSRISKDYIDRLEIQAQGDRIPFEKNEDGIHHKRFECVADAISYAHDLEWSTNPLELSAANGYYTHAVSGTRKWTLNNTADTLCEMFIKPKADAIRTIEKFVEHLQTEIDLPKTPQRQRRRNLDMGAEIDIDRYLANDPMMWEEMGKEPKPARVIKIGVNVSVSCSKRRKQLLCRGAAAVALAEYLQSQGRNVEIVCFSCSTGKCEGVGKSIVEIVAKRANEPIDLTTLAACCAEIAFFRSILVCGMLRGLPGAPLDGLGRPTQMTGKDFKERGIDFAMNADVFDEGHAKRWLEEQVEKYSTSTQTTKGAEQPC